MKFYILIIFSMFAPFLAAQEGVSVKEQCDIYGVYEDSEGNYIECPPTPTGGLETQSPPGEEIEEVLEEAPDEYDLEESSSPVNDQDEMEEGYYESSEEDTNQE